jgi:hypothetical protein
MTGADYMDPRDLEHIETLPAAEREVVASSLVRHRRPDRLRAGDELPALSLLRLEDGTGVELATLAADRPLCLVFGSFT